MTSNIKSKSTFNSRNHISSTRVSNWREMQNSFVCCLKRTVHVLTVSLTCRLETKSHDGRRLFVIKGFQCLSEDETVPSCWRRSSWQGRRDQVTYTHFFPWSVAGIFSTEKGWKYKNKDSCHYYTVKALTLLTN